jgi:PKD repeat protein
VRFTNVSDAPGDLPTLRYSFATSVAGLASSYATAGTAASQNITFPDNGNRQAYGRIFDKDGAFRTYEINIPVVNVAPTVTITGAPANSPEGTAITLGSTVTDPGADTFTYSWSVTKNGSAYPTGTPTNGTSFTFTPNDNGTYVVNLTVTDDDGGVGVAGSAAGPTDVLIIYDVATASGTTALRNALAAAGMNVALSFAPETAYSGSNPFLTPYEAVIHLNGTTWSTDMPGAGQQALVNYVQNGGGYIGSEWNAWEFGQGRLRLMGDLILIATTGSSSGSLTLTDVPGQSGHPILANVPSPASFSGGFTFGRVRNYGSQPATALMRDQFGNDAVAVREFGTGRVVAFHNAGNYTSGTLTDPDLLQLYVDGVKWAARAGGGLGAAITVTNVAPALADVVATGAAEGAVATVTGRVTDVGAADTHTVTVAWGDGTSSTAAVNADGTFTASHVYRDDSPSGTPSDVYQVGVVVRDDDGAFSGGGAQELVSNGGFESGFTGWTVNTQNGSWTLNNGSFDPAGPGLATAPISGQFDALAWQNGPSRLILSEPIVVPANVTSAVLSWSDRIRNHHFQFEDPNQEWRVRVLGATGGVLREVYSTNPGDPVQQIGPNRRSFDLTSLLQGLGGQTVRLSFELEDNRFFFNVNLDDVSLLVTTGPGIPLTVTNVAPTAPALVVSPAVGEDGTVTLTGTFTDAGVDDTHTVTVDWGDGSQTVLGGGATVPVSPAVEYNGHRYIVIRQQGLSWFDAQEQAQRLGGNLVTINDAAENSFVSELLRQNFGFYALAWIGFSDERTEGQFEWVSGEEPTYTNWFVRDGEPNDFPPQVTEDFTLTNYAFGFGPGWWNDVSGTRESGVAWGAYAVVEVNPTRTFTLTHRYADDNADDAFPINVTVTDDDTGTSTASAVAAVVNSAPAALAVTADAVTINEDGSVTLTGSFTDRGTLDSHTVTIDWKDGTTSQVAVPAFPGTPSANVSLTASAEFGGHTYHFISTRLSWDAAEAEARRMGGHLVTINSAAENLFLLEYIRRAARTGDVQTWIGLSDGGGTGPFRWASGEPLSFTAWAAGEPGNPAGPTGIAFNFNNTQIGARWGDFPAGTPLFAVIEVDGKRTFTATHRYLDDDPTGTPADVYSIGVTVADDDGGSVSASVPVTVNNVAPVIGSLTGPVAGTPTAATPGGAAVTFSGVRGQPLAFSTAFADVGTLDTHEVQWDFGDGTVIDWAAASGYSAGAPAHAYTATGTYTVTVSVRDDDGGVVSFAAPVEIKVIEMQADPNDPTKTTLAVGGTTGDDDIEIDTGSVQVFLGGVSLGSYHPTGSITVFAQDGDDDVRVAGSVALPAWLYGGAGNDRLKGGAGHDVLLGGDGDDLLVGGQGRDFLIAGAGADRVVGNADDDVMIAGTTAYDDDRLALGLLRGVWLDPDRTAADRIAALQSPSTLPGGVRLDSATVFHDESADVMTGSSGNDWFLLDTSRDRATDMTDDAFDPDREFIENP